MSRSLDTDEYQFLSTPGADLQPRLATSEGAAEIQIFGNRAGLLSFANILLWFMANAWRREFLSLAELPFVHFEHLLSVCIRLTDDQHAWHGLISRTDRGAQFEWLMSEDDLQRVALLVHRLVSGPGHEYDRLEVAEGSEAGVQIRMTDVAEWLERGQA
jgi:hypothetical protein